MHQLKIEVNVRVLGKERMDSYSDITYADVTQRECSELDPNALINRVQVLVQSCTERANAMLMPEVVAEVTRRQLVEEDKR